CATESCAGADCKDRCQAGRGAKGEAGDEAAFGGLSLTTVIARSAATKQPRVPPTTLDCFASLAMTERMLRRRHIRHRLLLRQCRYRRGADRALFVIEPALADG